MSPGLRSNCAPHNREPVATSTSSVANAQEAAALHHSSSEHGAHIELAAHGLRVNLAALVPKYSALRHHAQSWHRRQDIDKAAGDAVAEVFVLRVATNVLERQNRERADDL